MRKPALADASDGVIALVVADCIRIRDMAERLIRIAAERALRRAPVIEAPPHAWEEFASRFPYQETQDQEEAIADVMADLERGQPMDRLILRRDWREEADRIKRAFVVARDLAERIGGADAAPKEGAAA